MKDEKRNNDNRRHSIEENVDHTIRGVIERLDIKPSQKKTLSNFIKTAMGWHLDEFVTDKINDLENQPFRLSDAISSYSQDKKKLTNLLNKLLELLNNEYDGHIEVQSLDEGEKYLEIHVRRIEILRYLQEGPHTREEIAKHCGVSPRTIATDLSILQNGYDFLHYQMNIQLNPDNTYDSSIHPIFLPLNLSEIYSLTIGLKLIDQQSNVFGDIYHTIADSIYGQLTPYAKNIIDTKAKDHNLHFQDLEKSYRNEKSYLSDELQHQRSNRIILFVKTGQRCKIEFVQDQKMLCKTGWLSLSSNSMGTDFERVVIHEPGEIPQEISIRDIITLDPQK